MDAGFTLGQRAVAELAARVFAGEAGVERIKAVEATDDRIDHALWATLAGTGLLGVTAPEADGGTGGGAVDMCCLLEQHGRSVSPVPLACTLAALATIAVHGSGEQRARWVRPVVEGDVRLVAAADLAKRGAPVVATAIASGDGCRVDGELPCVAGAAGAALLVVARDGTGPGERLFLVPAGAAGVWLEPVVTTDRLPHANVRLDGAPAEAVGDAEAVAHLRAHLRVALSAVALGVAEEALQRAAAYTSQRHQFGRPLSSFQSTAHRAADCYLDVEAMRVTLWQAAGALDERDPSAEDAALVAAWWAADAGARVVQAVQHLHGGLGADIDYPIHRYYLWGTQLDIDLGGASALLAEIGDGIARRALTTAEEAIR